MFKFSHPELDGQLNSLIGRGSILQMVDPNDNAQARWQVTAVDDMLFSRRLPCAEFGDVWRDEPGIRQWESIDTLPTWSLIMDWWQSQLGTTRTLEQAYAWRKKHGSPAGRPADQYVRLTLATDLHTITTSVDYWPQAVPCPKCGDWIMWHEDGYAPGRRSCRNGCKRHWQITMSSGAGRWTMNRVKN